jgi:anti-anti-sigma factor
LEQRCAGKPRVEEHDVPVTLEQTDALTFIHLEGAIGIECAAELKELLVQRLNSGSAVRVSLEEATVLDVTAIQLLWAASREANRAGVEFALEGQAPEMLRAAFAMAGMGEFPVPA